MQLGYCEGVNGAWRRGLGNDIECPSDMGGHIALNKLNVLENLPNQNKLDNTRTLNDPKIKHNFKF